MQLSKQLMAQANAALAPLVPVFNVIDTVLALFQTVKSIPDAITHLDPTKITDELPDVAQKASKLLAIVPQLSVPLMILGLIDVLLAFLGGLSGQLRALIDQQVRIQHAENRAAELGNAQLQTVVDCSRGARRRSAAEPGRVGCTGEPAHRLLDERLHRARRARAATGPVGSRPRRRSRAEATR
jgi:hypothetical protein